MNVEPICAEFHSDNSFREQIATLKLVGEDKETVTFLRSFHEVCQPGCASFDDDNPGADTFRAWELIDSYIEECGVRGIFHTHPSGILSWSGQDIRAQNGLAKANGSMVLWHGVQACSGEGMIIYGSEFVCSWMENGRVFRYSYGMIEDHLSNPVITLPVPPAIQWMDGAYIIHKRSS